MGGKEATTMSVREMRELLGIKKTDSYWLIKKRCFEVVEIAGRMRVVKSSFEAWYAGQTHYRKINGEEPGTRLRTESYSAQEIGKMLGITTSSVYDLIHQAGLETVSISNRLRVLRDSYDVWYANQSHYRNAQDRERDRLIEQSSITVPEMGRMLGIDRRAAWKLHTKAGKSLITIRVAGKPRVTKESFEAWYQGQSEYVKVSEQPMLSSKATATESKRLCNCPADSAMSIENKAFFMLNEAALLLGLHERDLYRMIQSHDIQGKKIGKCWYVRQEELQSLLKQHHDS